MFEKSKAKSKLKALKKLANSGDAQAVYDLAMFLIDGEINSIQIKKDKKKAYSLLEVASYSGHAQSKFYLKRIELQSKAKKGVEILDDIFNSFK